MIDNYVTGTSGFIGKRLVSKLEGSTIAIEHGDLNHQLSLYLMPFRRFFFLSAYGNMAHQVDPKGMLTANVANLGMLLSQILADGILPESLIYVSSSSVTLPVQTPYSRTKRAGEEMVQAMPIPGCIVRPYSVTGIGEQSKHLIPTLIRSCLTGSSTYFVPDATHDFVDVEDVVDGLIKLADQRAVGVFEFGRGTAVTNQEVLHIIEKACGKKANIQVVNELRSYDSPEWVCRDFTAREYGWEPKKSLEQSVAEMVETFIYEHS